MKLQFLSDIHLEIRDFESYESIVTPQADILALLGDIGVPSPSLEKFLAWCSSRFEYVFYVPGNHEYYNQEGISIDEINNKLQEICDRTKVIFMNNHVCVLGKIALIGSILWSYIPPHAFDIVQSSLNDYKYIYATPRQLITPLDTSNEFVKNMSFLYHSIIDMRKQNKTIVVLTHHTPLTQGTSHPRYDKTLTTHAFSTDIRLHYPDSVTYWLCGHTHFNFRIKTDQFELISNQWGYTSMPESSYDPNLVLDL